MASAPLRVDSIRADTGGNNSGEMRHSHGRSVQQKRLVADDSVEECFNWAINSWKIRSQLRCTTSSGKACRA